MGIVAGDDVNVAVADPVGDPAHQHLVGPGREHLDLFHHDRLLHLVQDRRCRLHGSSLAGRRELESAGSRRTRSITHAGAN
jgi:hypothetical protein